MRNLFFLGLLSLASIQLLAQERPCYPFADPQKIMQKGALISAIKTDPLWLELEAIQVRRHTAIQYGTRFIKIDRQTLNLRPATGTDKYAALREVGLPNAKEIVDMDQRIKELRIYLHRKYPAYFPPVFN